MQQFKILDVFYIRNDTIIVIENGYNKFQLNDIIHDDFGSEYIIASMNFPTLANLTGENNNVGLLIKGKHCFVTNQVVSLKKRMIRNEK